MHRSTARPSLMQHLPRIARVKTAQRPGIRLVRLPGGRSGRVVAGTIPAVNASGGILTPTRPFWFYWPVTFSVAATVAAVHLFTLAHLRGNRSRALGAAGVAFLAVAVPVVPLAAGVYPDCSDGTHGINFRAAAAVLGAVGPSSRGSRSCGASTSCSGSARPRPKGRPSSSAW